jgi:hypothetical protein
LFFLFFVFFIFCFFFLVFLFFIALFPTAVHFHLEEYDEAISRIDLAIKLAPTHPEVSHLSVSSISSIPKFYYLVVSA